MSKILVSYFSASGVTKGIAGKIASAVKGDLFEIEPVNKYTSEDLDWTNKNSRSTVEMNDKSFRPPILNKVSKIDEYDIVIIGFPVWWYTAPTIINTFIEENNLSEKNVFVFVTSGSSGYEKSLNDLKETYTFIKFVSGKRFDGSESDEEYLKWIKNDGGLNLINKALETDFLEQCIYKLENNKELDIEIINDEDNKNIPLEMNNQIMDVIANIFEKYEINKQEIEISEDEISNFIDNYAMEYEEESNWGRTYFLLKLKDYKELSKKQLDELGFPFVYNDEQLKNRVVQILKEKKYYEIHNNNIFLIIKDLEENLRIPKINDKMVSASENIAINDILNKFETIYNWELKKQLKIINKDLLPVD